MNTSRVVSNYICIRTSSDPIEYVIIVEAIVIRTG